MADANLVSGGGAAAVGLRISGTNSVASVAALVDKQLAAAGSRISDQYLEQVRRAAETEARRPAAPSRPAGSLTSFSLDRAARPAPTTLNDDPSKLPNAQIKDIDTAKEIRKEGQSLGAAVDIAADLAAIIPGLGNALNAHIPLKQIRIDPTFPDALLEFRKQSSPSYAQVPVAPAVDALQTFKTSVSEDLAANPSGTLAIGSASYRAGTELLAKFGILETELRKASSDLVRHSNEEAAKMDAAMGALRVQGSYSRNAANELTMQAKKLGVVK